MNYTHYEIATRANQVRNAMGINCYGIPNIFKTLEDMGYKVFRYPLGEKAILGAAAVYDQDRVIITNSSVILSREIFTAAHELGHHVLHLDDRSGAMVDIDIANEENLSIFERDANFFAASLLMPKRTLLDYVEENLKIAYGKAIRGIDIARIQSEFNVSFDAAIGRLQTVGRINSDEKQSLVSEKTEKTAHRLIKSISGNQNLLESSRAKCIPPDYLDIVIKNYENALTSEESVGKILRYFDISYDVQEHEEIIVGRDGGIL